MSGAPQPSGTVMVVREAGSGLEVLLLERPGREGRRGASVFPGGRVEAADRVAEPEGFLESARRAAVREAQEEAALSLRSADLVPISRWITPDLAPRRFDTWFFATAVDAGSEVRVDGSEIHHHRWLSPGAALDAFRAREIELAPPTFVTVTWLTAYRRAADALRELSRPPLVIFEPRIHRLEKGACILYPGDAGYESGEIDAPGARHRLWSEGPGWRYERD